jgi:hypothetical protein
MKEYQDNTEKLARANARKIFLVNCRKDNLIPAHIQHSHKCLNSAFKKQNPTTKKAAKVQSNFRARILSLEIETTFSNIYFLEKQNRGISRKLQQQIPATVYYNYIECQKLVYKKEFRKATKDCSKKFENLTSKTMRTKDLLNNDVKKVINLTQHDIPEDMIEIIALGPKFSITPTKEEVPMPLLIAEIERIVHQCPSSSQNSIRSEIVNIVTNKIVNAPIKNIDKDTRNLQKKIQENRQLH